MPISILAAAGAAATKAAATVGQAAVATAKAGVEAGAVAGKAGGQVAATTAQTTTAAGKTAATLGEGAANAAQTLTPKAVQGGSAALPEQVATDLKTGKVLPDEVLNRTTIPQETDLSQRITELKNRYCDELEHLSPCKDTLNTDSIRNGAFQRLSPEETISKRLEFDKAKPDLIREWETINHRSWPRYDTDVYSEAGNLIRPQGGLFDAHHAHPLGMGGENTVSNITPMNAVNHYDKQGIHAPGGAYDQLFKLLEA